jgi:hypothetical protein
MLRIALPQLCGALGAAEAPCRVFHRLSGSVYLYGSIAPDAVTYLHKKRKIAAQSSADCCLIVVPRSHGARPRRLPQFKHRTLGERAKRYRTRLGCIEPLQALQCCALVEQQQSRGLTVF